MSAPTLLPTQAHAETFGALKRFMAGMQIFVTEASGRGQIAFSRDGTGHILAIHMNQGDEILFGGSGFFIDRFHARHGSGVSAQRFTTGFLGGFSLFMNRFTGPGKIALQSMSAHAHTGR